MNTWTDSYTTNNIQSATLPRSRAGPNKGHGVHMNRQYFFAKNTKLVSITHATTGD